MKIKRPLVWMLLFLMLGIVLGRYTDAANAPGIVIFLAVALAVLTGCLYKLQRLTVVFLFPVLAIIGFGLTQRAFSPFDVSLQAKATVEGRVESVSVSSAGNMSVLMQAQVQGEKLRLLVRLPEGAGAEIGQLLTVRGDIQPLDTARNPGAFDEFLFWRARGAAAKMYAGDVVQGDVRPTLTGALYAFRTRFSAVFYEIMPAEEAGVLDAMITGSRDGLTDEMNTLYRDAGIFHILAVSGTHMTILAFAISAVLRRLKLSRAAASLVSFGVIVLYCIFTGACVAAVRAVVMFGAVVLAPLVRRDADMPSSTSFAAICLLLVSPLYLWDVGFLYSFAAVFALVAGAPAVERMMLRAADKASAPPIVLRIFGKPRVRQAIAATAAVFLVTWPLTAWYFYQVSFISVLVNLILLPTVLVLTIFGFLAGLLGMVFMPLGMFAASVPYAILSGYAFVCRAAVSLPFATVLTGRPPLWLLALYMGALVTALASFRIRSGMARHGKKLALALFGLCVAAAGVNVVWPKPLEMAVLDVGQGDAIVFTRGQNAVIWDGGGRMNREIGDNTGVWVVLPYLRYKGVSRADAVLTHADADHALGIIEAIDAGVVRRLFVPSGLLAEGDIASALAESIAKSSIEVITLQPGDQWNMLPGASAMCVYPAAGSALHGNEGSLVCRVAFGERSFLLTGDVEQSGERRILDTYGAQLDADVLKLAHHGSRTSSTEAFLQAAAPTVAVASAARNSQYNHPSPEVVERLGSLGIELYATASRGAVIFRTDGVRLTVQTMVGE